MDRDVHYFDHDKFFFFLELSPGFLLDATTFVSRSMINHEDTFGNCYVISKCVSYYYYVSGGHLFLFVMFKFPLSTGFIVDHLLLRRQHCFSDFGMILDFGINSY